MQIPTLFPGHPLCANILPLFSACAFVFCLTACAPPVQPSSRSETVSNNLSDVRMPVLRSAYFESKWGKPDIEVMADGTYRLRYRQGTTLNFVVIQSLTKMNPAPAAAPDWEEAHDDPEGTTPAPPPHKQSWKHTTILGQPVKWYQADGGSGADFPAYRTTDFSLTTADGRTGIYQITVTSDSGTKAADWIHRVNW